MIHGSDKRLVCEASWHADSGWYPTQAGTESNFALIAAAVNALADLLAVAEAAQRTIRATQALATGDADQLEEATAADEALRTALARLGEAK